ncbi:CsgG/HfaB family protein [Aureimonas sp. AU40]|uniref:CsgG/HfaB family protein n=1 Tax=Aureimonas sp. AU40 TaxID=1637747 RepID=UPI0007831453|nr:CsgG/HfaB family protein [Aureimonas sp. AU40]
MSLRFRLALILRASLLGASAAALSGCVTNESALDPAPVVAPVSKQNDLLRDLPPPREKTVVAVYDIEDLTGQFKERENVQSLSRAVTQGGAAILIKALQDAGERRWFTVLERKALENLLRERQILTEMRRIYKNENTINASALPPLLHAGIIIEGGIIGYDTNITTGGAGARLLGIGGDAKYINDVVTVTLRAVSTKTGEVLASVTTRKAVVSYSLTGGTFRYVKLDSLLEAEAGVTYNEPKQIAVQSAIEQAVLSLVMEGAELRIWSFADPQAGANAITAYRGAKYGDFLDPTAPPPPRPVTENAAKMMATVPSRPPELAVRPLSAGPVTSTTRPVSRAAPQPAGQSGIRQVPGVGPVPAEENQPPQLPPAPTPGEPSLGSIKLPDTHSVASL